MFNRNLVFFLFPHFLFSLPEDPFIVSGVAEFFLEKESSMMIQASDKAWIDWNSFSIGELESVYFSLPERQATVVNFVKSQFPSNISGMLGSNGQVILLNSQGIVFGHESKVDVGSLIASTLSLNRDLFLSSKELKFSELNNGYVFNHGSLISRAGDIFLLGKEISNSGHVKAMMGDVGFVGVELASINEREFSQVLPEHFSRLTFAGNAGIIEAPGHSVFLLGHQISLSEASLIDTSSITSGGSVFIGGGWKGDRFPKASCVRIDRSAAIRADAENGMLGGTVVAWAEDALSFYGLISAKGTEGSLGGRVETSGHRFLDIQGIVDTGGGTWLIDPVDITISTSPNAGIAPANLPSPPPMVANPYLVPVIAGAATINNISLSNALGVNDVIIDAAGGSGGSGSISIQPNANVVWNSPFSLTLNAAAAVSIQANVQNTGAGNVVLNSSGLAPITLSIVAGVPSPGIAFGSAQGLTSINAPNAPLNLNPPSVAGLPQRAVRIGYTASNGDILGGPISVICGQLTMNQGGASIDCPAQIGHGAIGTGDPMGTPFQFSTTSAASITLSSSGSVNLNLGGNRCSKLIGHGTQLAMGDGTLVPTSSLNGDVSVTASTGNISMQTLANSVNLNARIGHGIGAATANPTFAIVGSVSGDLSALSLNGSIIMSGTAGSNTTLVIGHGSNETSGPRFLTASGNISAFARSNININSPALGGIHCLIGTQNQQIDTLTQCVRVAAGNDVTISTNAGRCVIGTLLTTNAMPVTNLFDSNVTLLIGRDLNVTTASGATSLIGSSRNGASFPTTFIGSTSVCVGGNITASGTGATSAGPNIEAPGNLNVSAGGNILLSAGQFSANIGSSNRIAGGNATARIYAGGNIIATNGASANGFANLGYERVDLPPMTPYNVFIRAGGDLQLATGYDGAARGTVSGEIYIAADSAFNSGELWTTGAGNFASVCNQPLPCAFSQTGFLIGSPLSTSSPTLTSNLLGAFRVVESPLVGGDGLIQFNTTSGNVTVLSAPNRVIDGNFQNIEIGTASPNQLDIVTTFGNIIISGSSPSAGFHNVTINSVAIPWTSGSIYVQSTNDITTNAVVSSSGVIQPISLIADVDLTGGGFLTLNNSVSTAGGPILLQSGFGISNSSSVIQNAGAVTSSGGDISILAAQNIELSGFSPICVNSGGGSILVDASTGSINIDENIVSTSGSISMSARLDILLNPVGGTSLGAGGIVTTSGPIFLTAERNISVNGDPTSILSATGPIQTISGDDTIIDTGVSSSGSVLMIAGNHMFLNGTSNISSGGSTVTLVVDADFPSAPLIGSGFLEMDPGASIISAGQLKIYTARQPYNTILGTLNGAAFARGTLFQNTNTEVWCTYYDNGVIGVPFTVYYKDCLQQLTQQAMVINTQLSDGLDPMGEILAHWRPMIQEWRFKIWYDRADLSKQSSSIYFIPNEPYWISSPARRYVNLPIIANDRVMRVKFDN